MELFSDDITGTLLVQWPMFYNPARHHSAYRARGSCNATRFGPYDSHRYPATPPSRRCKAISPHRTGSPCRLLSWYRRTRQP